MAFLRLTLIPPASAVDAVAAVLEDRGAVAVTARDAGDVPVLEPEPGTHPHFGRTRLEALLPLDVDVGAVLAACRTAAATTLDADVDFVADDAWTEAYRQHVADLTFGTRLRIIARDAPQGADFTGSVLRLDPGLAFGAGTHATTRLCLEALAAAELAGRTVTDFGCGSGILAIAAALLGADHVDAVDRDPQALLATRDNAAYNAVPAGRVAVVPAERWRRRGRPSTLLVANVLTRTLVMLAPLLAQRVTHGGVLVLSGILEAQAGQVMDAYPGFAFGEPEVLDGWVRLDGRQTRR